MEEMETPTEKMEEEIHDLAQEMREPWVMGVALTSALLAVLAAISALLAGHHINEAMIDEIQCSDQWAFYQAKGIKAEVLETKLALLAALGKAPAGAKESAKLTEYRHDQGAIKKEADEKRKSSDHHLRQHNALAPAVTLFQVAIGAAAISVLTRKRWFWWLSLILGLLGVVAMIHGLVVA